MTSLAPERLRAFFHPRSIALVGATDRSRWSLSTFSNLKNFNFPGPVYCVNPNYEQIHAEPAYKRLSDLPQRVDMAYVMVPTRQVYPIVEEAAALGIRNLVVLTAGFSETGEQGRQLEQQILQFAQKHDIVILGPNGNGFVNVVDQTMPYGLPLTPPMTKGPVGIVLQSGALVSVVIALAQARHVGMSLLVSMGNETMISATDMINYFIEDEATRVIAVFLESIRQPEIFRQVALKALEHKKPIVALKVGKSEVGARAAMAHTGALVGNDAVNDALFKQLGIIRVDSLEDLLITSGVLGYNTSLPGRRVGIVTPSGGACDILSDRAHEVGIELPEFSPETAQGLQQILPDFSTVHNPLDVTGYIVIDRTLQQRALEVVMKDPGFDFTIFVSEPPRIAPAPPLLEPFLEYYDSFGETLRSAPRPVVMLSNTSIDLTPFAQSIADRLGIHYAGGMEHGMKALGKGIWWHEIAAQASERSQQQEPAPTITLNEVPEGSWPEYKAREFLQAYGVPVVPGKLVTNEEEAVAAAEAFGFPVALKIQSSEILHKSDIGGVLLNVASADEVRQGFRSIMDKANAQTLTRAVDGILISPMRPAGIELLVGVIQDPLWGQVLAVGLGGILVEVLKDTSIRVLPVQRSEIKNMLLELQGAAIFQGVRGQAAVDMDALVDSIFRVAQISQELKDHLESLEINPFLLYNSHLEALDVLMTWKQKY
ncbi:MAG TPA: acetate--CoA ligase family protein [Ktedonobacteraceae bacterium]|nr:acetate--CoA ligase family protein [Ktedonobacteraceae bacterium]